MCDEKSVTTSLKPSGVCLTISCVGLSVENCLLHSLIQIKACKMNYLTQMLVFEIPKCKTFSKHSNPKGEIGGGRGELRRPSQAATEGDSAQSTPRWHDIYFIP